MEYKHGKHNERTFVLQALFVFSLYVISLERFWRIEIKCNSPLGLAHCHAFIVHTDICSIEMNCECIWHQPTATPLGSETFKEPEGNLAWITISQIWYCAFGGNKIDM